MTFDKERHDYIEAQPEVLEAHANHRKRHQDIQEADRNVIVQARKVEALLAAWDSTFTRQFKFAEEVSEDDEMCLKRLTNADSEEWFYRMDLAQSCVQESIAKQCEAVASAQERFRELQKDHRICKNLQMARDVAGKRYDEQKAQAQKPKRGRPRKIR
jgi:hypothetical protein